jgi:phospholipid/cholesterol/gamma-HCH transport system ATP-binding protein
MTEPHIVLSGVRKAFGSKHVLNGVDLAVPKGSSLVVIGGSGTGKSVMLKCILGILQPDGGSITVGGQEVTGLRGAGRDAYLARFGMLFQGSALFDSLPVWENVAFGLIQGRNMARNKSRDIAIEKLGQVGLGEEVAKLYPAELSGGMQKRVGLARAIAADPEIIFFDDGRCHQQSDRRLRRTPRRHDDFDHSRHDLGPKNRRRDRHDS